MAKRENLNGEDQKVDINDALRELQEAEDSICRVLEIAMTTSAELQNLPLSNHENIKSLSHEYFENLQRAHHITTKHISTLKSSPSNGDFSGDVKREIEKSLRSIDVLIKKNHTA